MLDQIVGIVLLGLGLRTPHLPPGDVMGDQTVKNEHTLEEKKKELMEQKNALQKEGKMMQLKTASGGAQKPGDAGREFSAGVRNLKEGSMSAQERREKMEALLQQKKEQHEAILEEMKVKREHAKEAFETQREAFKKRLATIKDESKKRIVEKMDTNISAVNTKRTEAMTNRLNHLDEILAKVTTKADELETRGVDVAAVDSAVAQAQSAIAAAKAAVSAQAGKEYIIGVTTENNLKTDVGRATDALQKDLKTTLESLEQAHKAVQAAIEALAHAKAGAEGSQQ